MTELRWEWEQLDRRRGRQRSALLVGGNLGAAGGHGMPPDGSNDLADDLEIRDWELLGTAGHAEEDASMVREIWGMIGVFCLVCVVDLIWVVCGEMIISSLLISLSAKLWSFDFDSLSWVGVLVVCKNQCLCREVFCVSLGG